MTFQKCPYAHFALILKKFSILSLVSSINSFPSSTNYFWSFPFFFSHLFLFELLYCQIYYYYYFFFLFSSKKKVTNHGLDYFLTFSFDKLMLSLCFHLETSDVVISIGLVVFIRDQLMKICNKLSLKNIYICPNLYTICSNYQ